MSSLSLHKVAISKFPIYFKNSAHLFTFFQWKLFLPSFSIKNHCSLVFSKQILWSTEFSICTVDFSSNLVRISTFISIFPSEQQNSICFQTFLIFRGAYQGFMDSEGQNFQIEKPLFSVMKFPSKILNQNYWIMSFY